MRRQQSGRYGSRASRPWIAVAAVAAVAVAASCTPPPPPPPPTQYCAPAAPASPTAYNAAFDGLRGAGTRWLASDGAVHAPLADGRVVWLFGDTIVGERQPNGAVAAGWRLLNNSIVVQSGACFAPLTAGSRGNEAEPIPDAAADEWSWPTAAVVEGTTLRVFTYHMRRTGSGVFGFEQVRMEIASLSLPSLTFTGTHALPAWKPAGETVPPSWASTGTSAGGYFYAYGRVRQAGPLFPPDHHYVARVPVGQALTDSAWEFWTGDATGWTGDATAAVALAFDDDPTDATPAGPDRGPIAPLAVAPDGAGFLGSALDADVFSTTIATWDATTPQGPWVRRAVAADTSGTVDTDGPGPDGPADLFGYGGRVVLDLAGSPMAIWSVNHPSLDAVLADPSRYRVWFAGVAAGSAP
jgi:hypothetical protein